MSAHECSGKCHPWLPIYAVSRTVMELWGLGFGIIIHSSLDLSQKSEPNICLIFGGPH